MNSAIGLSIVGRYQSMVFDGKFRISLYIEYFENIIIFELCRPKLITLSPNVQLLSKTLLELLLKDMNKSTIETNIIPKPFLKWAGGKRWLLKHITSINNLKFNNYFEPFLGGGSVFFSINNNKKSFLSDLNPDLIQTYNCIKKNPLLVLDKLKKFKNTETFYYNVRKKKFECEYENSAKFIYLNKTSFNGIYRVNQKGEFNVPFGYRKENLDYIDLPNIIAVSQKLQNATIKCQDFEKTLDKVKEGDLVFLDPPYTTAHEKNGFIQYNQHIFSLDDQIRLSKIVDNLNDIGAYYILTNAKHDSILEIYNNISSPTILSRKSTVGGVGARREQFNEYIFSNCI